MPLDRTLIRATALVVILGGFCAWVAWYVGTHLTEFKVISEISPVHVVALITLCFLTLVCNGLYLKYLLIAYGLHIHWKEWISLTVVSSATNYLMPLRGGAGVRAAYLRSRYRFGFFDFIATLAATFVIYFIVHGLLGLLGLLLLVRRGYPINWPIALVFLGVTTVSLLVILTNLQIPEYRAFPLRQIAYMFNRWSCISQNRPLFRRLLVNSIFFAILTVGQVKLSFAAFGVDLRWDSLFFFTAAQAIAALLTITPGAIGIAEALTVYMAGTLSYTTAEGILAHGLWRVITLLTIFGSAPFALHFLGMKFFRVSEQPGEGSVLVAQGASAPSLMKAAKRE